MDTDLTECTPFEHFVPKFTLIMGNTWIVITNYLKPSVPIFFDAPVALRYTAKEIDDQKA